MPQSNTLPGDAWDMKVIFGLGLMHAIALLAPFYWSWSAFTIFIVLVIISGMLGVTMCYHRLLTHRSFETYKWVEYTLTLFGCLSLQGSPLQWVGVHRIHHKYSDEDEDPHSPRHGFTWAHVTWLLRKTLGGRDPYKATKDLQRDPVMRLFDRFHYVPQILLAFSLFGFGYWTGGTYTAIAWVVWGIGLRTTVVYHITWFVNSAAHTWGYRSYETTEKDKSQNLWWVALIGFGEGWHNNHHANQNAANHGRRWWELDPTYRTIWLLELVGLAWEVKKAPA